MGQWGTVGLWPWGGLGLGRAEAAASTGTANCGGARAARWRPCGVRLLGGGVKKRARRANLSLPAVPAASGSVGAAARGDERTLWWLGGASARRLVGAVITGGDACAALAG